MVLKNAHWGAVYTGLVCALACSSNQEQNAGPSNGGGRSVGSGGALAGGAGPTAGGSGSQTGGGSADGGAPPSSGGTATGGDGAGGSAAGGTPGFSLGMNDVTILAPTPADAAVPVLLFASDVADDGTPLVPEPLYGHLAEEAGSLPLTDGYDRLQLVALRFDLCDHNAPGPCPLTGDASMRLVFQPMSGNSGAEDIGFHAFYVIREEEVPAALERLVELSKLRAGAAEPLAPSESLTLGDEQYASKVRAFVRAYGGEQRLVRLTINSQSLLSAAVKWFFRGVERKENAFEDMLIHGTTESTQTVTLASDAFFQMLPVTDAPAGLALGLDGSQFKAAAREQQLGALAAFVQANNPLTHAPDTVACVACHTSTVALATRAEDLQLDPATLPGRFATPFNVSIASGMSSTSDRTLRALGWIGTTPMISERVAHDTALVLEDIARRYP